MIFVIVAMISGLFIAAASLFSDGISPAIRISMFSISLILYLLSINTRCPNCKTHVLGKFYSVTDKLSSRCISCDRAVLFVFPFQYLFGSAKRDRK